MNNAKMDRKYKLKTAFLVLIVIFISAFSNFVKSEDCPACSARPPPKDGPSKLMFLSSALDYCPSIGGSKTYEYIQDVSYNQKPGETLAITVDIFIANPSGCTYAQPCPAYDESPEYVNAWIDWDGDGVFEPEERVIDADLTGYVDINYYGIMSTSDIVAIPSNAISPAWMRVNLGWGEDPDDPCEYEWGWGDITDEEVVIEVTVSESLTKRDYDCPPKDMGKDGDIDGNGVSDWFYETVKTDDYGNKLELWCVDPSEDIIYDEYFTAVFNNHLVGKCTYNQGRNVAFIEYIKDSDGSGKPDRIIRTGWTSIDKGSDDVDILLWKGNPDFIAVEGEDRMTFHFDVDNNQLYVKHYDEEENMINSIIGPPPSPGGSWVIDGEPVPEQQYPEGMILSPFEEQPLVYLTDNYFDYGTDVDGDGIFDYLTIDAEVMLSEPGHCVIKARLVDANGKEIVWAENTSYLETNQTQIIQLNFDGETIYNHSVNGPYYLRNVYVYHTGDPSKPHHVYEAYTTGDYKYWQFGLMPPYELKLEALNKLKELRTGKKCKWWSKLWSKECIYESTLNKAITYLEKSLDNAYWIDNYTLNPQLGHKVFNNEKNAVKELMKLEK